jgi:hypothetical protein
MRLTLPMCTARVIAELTDIGVPLPSWGSDPLMRGVYDPVVFCVSRIQIPISMVLDLNGKNPLLFTEVKHSALRSLCQ